MKPITQRPIPEGYTTEWDNTIWNVGIVFLWSDIFDDYLQSGRITVKPGDTLAEAFEREMNEPMWKEFEVFFVNE